MKFIIGEGTIPRFLIVIFSALTVGFFVQHFLLASVFSIPEISWAIRGYAINGGLAILLFIGLLKFVKKEIENLSSIFLFTSVIKFIVFFAVFRPHFNLDGEINKSEFLSFFIPYALALIVEVYFIVQVLNSIPVDKSKFIDLSAKEEEEQLELIEEKNDFKQEEE